MAKTLVVYYSQSRGNTKKIAREIASTLGADLTAIDTVQPYNCSYDQLVYGLSKTETQNKVCPPIKPLDKDPAYYDRIVLGTPTWWYTMAPAVRTFLTETDLTGKELVLFATHGGWPGHVIRDMKNACTGAKIACEMQVKFDSNGGDHLETPEANIDAWARDVKALL